MRNVACCHERAGVLTEVRLVRDLSGYNVVSHWRRYYPIWTDSDQPRAEHPMNAPAPKMKLPGHEEVRLQHVACAQNPAALFESSALSECGGSLF
jgi:hypothetical protein